MKGIQTRGAVAALAAAVIVFAAAPAHAGWGKLLVRGITYSLSPSIGTVQNGPNFNQNFFSQRYGINPLGDGRSYEFTRYFGSDTYGNPEQLNLGLLNVVLGAPPDTLLSGAGVYNRVGYNLRIVPEVYWTSTTVGRSQTNLTGTEAQLSPVQYNIAFNNGIQEVILNGALSYTTNGTVNALGFYDITFSANNTGTVQTDGAVGSDTVNTDFDVGPINLSGNIWIDAALAAYRYIGEQIGLPPELLPPQPARIKTPDEIIKDIAESRPFVLDDLNGALQPLGVNPADLAQAANVTPTIIVAGPRLNLVPEPGTIALLLAAASAFGVRRARRA